MSKGGSGEDGVFENMEVDPDEGLVVLCGQMQKKLLSLQKCSANGKPRKQRLNLFEVREPEKI